MSSFGGLQLKLTPTGPVDTNKAIQSTAGSYIKNRPTKNIRLHHFFAKDFVGIIHYQEIKQFQIAIAELQCKKVLLHHLWCLGLLLAPDSDKKRTTSGCSFSAAT